MKQDQARHENAHDDDFAISGDICLLDCVMVACERMPDASLLHGILSLKWHALITVNASFLNCWRVSCALWV